MGTGVDIERWSKLSAVAHSQPDRDRCLQQHRSEVESMTNPGELQPFQPDDPAEFKKGCIKTFGPVGPPYQVGRPLRRLADGDQLMKVTLVQTGEVTEYRLSRIVEDPDAR